MNPLRTLGGSNRSRCGAVAHFENAKWALCAHWVGRIALAVVRCAFCACEVNPLRTLGGSNRPRCGAVSFRSVDQKCRSEVPFRSVVQKCRLKVSIRSVPQQCCLEVSIRCVAQRVDYRSMARESVKRVKRERERQNDHNCQSEVSI